MTILIVGIVVGMAILVSVGTLLARGRKLLAKESSPILREAPPIEPLPDVMDTGEGELIISPPYVNWEDGIMRSPSRPLGEPRRTDKPALLYISPMLPSTGGSGLGMRAYLMLRLLAEHYRIWLLIAGVYSPFAAVESPVSDLCEEWTVFRLTDDELEAARSITSPPPSSLHIIHEEFDELSFDVVHVFRLYALPFARPYLLRAPEAHLDLDDVESLKAGRIADLHEVRWEPAQSARWRKNAVAYRALEDETLQLFHRIYVCSERDKTEIQDRARTDVCIVPNAVPLPTGAYPLPAWEPIFHFLFVASFGYFPNQDAVHFFVREIMPLMRQRTTLDFRLRIVGSNGDRFTEELGGLADVDIVGPVEDLAPRYREAHICVAPLRAGGGTRVKILEAFSYHRPVVSTSMGAEGIDARNGIEILLGNTSDEFAGQCVRLMEDATLAGRLIEDAFTLLQREYTNEAAARYMSECVESTRSARIDR